MNFPKHSRWLITLLLITLVLSVSAQDNEVTLPAVGSIPLASKIQVTADADDETQAIIQGDVGAVFPNAFVAVQNLYTGDREIVSSTSNGEFTASLYGRDQTPYWIAAFQRFPSDEAIDNAMGTTVYGEGDDNTFYVESNLGGNVPRYRVWGEHHDNAVSLDIQMDLVDNFPELDNLEIQLELWQFLDEVNPIRVILSNDELQHNENQLRFQTEINYEKNRFSNTMYFTGYVRSGNGEWQRWENNVLFGMIGQDVLNYSFALYDVSTGIDLSYKLKVNELYTVPSVNIRKYIVLPPDYYSLEPMLEMDELIPQSVRGELTYTITRPSGKIDTVQAQVIQTNTPIDYAYIRLMTDSELLKSYSFDEYGDYDIVVKRSLAFGDDEPIIEETAYQIRIAEKLYLSPTILSGTPLETGNALPVSVHIIPPLPAEITIDIIASQGFSTITGQANAQGYFTADSLLENELIYNMTYSATYEDGQGRLWSSDRLELSGVVMNPDLALIHGQRGLNGYNGVQQAWFDTTIYPDDDRNAGRQPYFPFYAGDVAYVPDASDGGIAIGGAFTDAVVVSTQGILLDTSAINAGLTGDDTLDQQLGVGIDGIRAGDYAFLFGHLSTEATYGIYGSLMVVEDEDAPARVLSPFMDKLNVFGQEVDVFFVPTGVRPAQVLTQGETLSIVGQVAPTLPAEVEVTVISPSGQKTHFTDVANAVGYFYSAENDLTLEEIGIWHVDIVMTYRGETSAGQVERPYPEGSLSYDVYVVPPDNPPLGEAEFMTETRSVTQTYALNIPEGWTNVRAFATVTTPSWILSHEELTVFPSGTSYTYNPTQLAREYPNVELLETADGNHVADVLTLTLVMTGTDADGEPAIRTRTYTIIHDVTYSTDGGQIDE